MIVLDGSDFQINEREEEEKVKSIASFTSYDEETNRYSKR